MEASFIMCKRKNSNLNKNIKNAEKEQEISGAAINAMFDQMAAVCMTMGMAYGVYVYMPVTCNKIF